MTYRDILVHVSRDRRTPARLDAAIGLAEHCRGRVTSVYVLPYPSLPTYAGTFEIPDDVLEDVSRQQRNWAADAECAFRERTAEKAVPSEWLLQAGDPIEAVTTCAHCADIMIVGQSDPDDPRSIRGLAVGDVGVDLLVMGAYGHRRTRELLLGGATRDILREMTVPVLMSH